MASAFEQHFINGYLTDSSSDPLKACRQAIERLEREMESLTFQRNWLRSEMERLLAKEADTGTSPTNHFKMKPTPVARRQSDTSLFIKPADHTNIGGRLGKSEDGSNDVFDEGNNDQQNRIGVPKTRDRRLTWSHEVQDQHDDLSPGGRPTSDSAKYYYMFVVEAMGTHYGEEDGFFSFTKGQKFDVLEETIPTNEDDADEERLFRVRDVKGTIGKVYQKFFLRCPNSEPLLARKTWYHGTVSDEVAKERLLPELPGRFLVKDSEKVIGSLEIFFRDTGAVNSEYIYAHVSGYSVLSRKFKTLDGVIDFYQKIPISENQILTKPLLRKVDK